MSLPLKDFRLGITESIDIWLDAEATAFGADKAEIAREILSGWARRKAHAFRVASRRFAANGVQPELTGLDWEEAGVTAKGGRR